MRNPTNMEDFIEAVKEDLTDSLDRRYPGIIVEHSFIEKPQGESYHGVRFYLPDMNVAPVMNIEPFYDQVTTNIPYREVIEDMDYRAQEAIDKMPEISSEPFIDYEAMKGRLVMQAIPINGNEDIRF